MESRDYQPPAPSDYDNVIELNRAFLAATGNLSRTQQKQLANAPFLLFSFREQQPEWWDRALAEQAELLRDPGIAPEPLRRVQTTALAFLWQLADRNPYAARIISGASVEWCERLTSMPLLTLVQRVGDRADLLVSRVEGDSGRDRPAQLVALHGLLTQSRADAYVSLPTAALQHAVEQSARSRKTGAQEGVIRRESAGTIRGA